jgi:hypothetical protein
MYAYQIKMNHKEDQCSENLIWLLFVPEWLIAIFEMESTTLYQSGK